MSTMKMKRGVIVFLVRNCIDFGNESHGMRIGLIQFVLGLFVSETILIIKIHNLKIAYL